MKPLLPLARRRAEGGAGAKIAAGSTEQLTASASEEGPGRRTGDKVLQD